MGLSHSRGPQACWTEPRGQAKSGEGSAARCQCLRRSRSEAPRRGGEPARVHGPSMGFQALRDSRGRRQRVVKKQRRPGGSSGGKGRSGDCGSGIMREWTIASQERGQVVQRRVLSIDREPEPGRPDCCLFNIPFSCTQTILTLFRGCHPHPKG